MVLVVRVTSCDEGVSAPRPPPCAGRARAPRVCRVCDGERRAAKIDGGERGAVPDLQTSPLAHVGVCDVRVRVCRAYAARYEEEGADQGRL